MDRVRLAPQKAASSRVKLRPRLAVAWTGVFENWSKQWVRRSYWRVRSVFATEEDALQECALVFCRCLDRYGRTVDNPAWFMALFKTSVARTWATYSLKCTAHRGVFADTGLEVVDGQVRTAGEDGVPVFTPADYNAGPLAAALAGASAEAREVLKMLADAPADVIDSLFGDGAVSADVRVRRWFRLPSGAKVASELRSLFFY